MHWLSLLEFRLFHCYHLVRALGTDWAFSSGMRCMDQALDQHYTCFVLCIVLCSLVSPPAIVLRARWTDHMWSATVQLELHLFLDERNCTHWNRHRIHCKDALHYFWDLNYWSKVKIFLLPSKIKPLFGFTWQKEQISHPEIWFLTLSSFVRNVNCSLSELLRLMLQIWTPWPECASALILHTGNSSILSCCDIWWHLVTRPAIFEKEKLSSRSPYLRLLLCSQYSDEDGSSNLPWKHLTFRCLRWPDCDSAAVGGCQTRPESHSQGGGFNVGPRAMGPV